MDSFRRSHLLRPRKREQHVQRTFVAFQIDHEGVAGVDLVGRREVEVGLEGVCHVFDLTRLALLEVI